MSVQNSAFPAVLHCNSHEDIMTTCTFDSLQILETGLFRVVSVSMRLLANSRKPNRVKEFGAFRFRYNRDRIVPLDRMAV